MQPDPDTPYGPMETVYRLEVELAADPRQVELTQALTQNPDRPHMGLAGRHGLYASDTWWDSVRSGRMPLETISGIIVRAYRAGQDNSGPPNTVEVETASGARETVGIHVNHRRDRRRFLPGRAVRIVYALDELKPLAAVACKETHCRIALTMAVTPEPAAAG
ncbi:hypothetical protein GCM10007301_46880 [Azorhizobium oxalatiphilum]|uniref:Uncharacterized protein n=1 Tax=Azorhizobium oxalatiphilum TaxID=980631 RepID=A0A917FIM6_9HYPH|nr:hypothetical protein [Azorhizobium oxalatiphilum]GGF81375.1 hypothetical protein GCM10007301_46880 [Azorhizobium oxalatiphilum]